jgi:hypothetical protein
MTATKSTKMTQTLLLALEKTKTEEMASLENVRTKEKSSRMTGDTLEIKEDSTGLTLLTQENRVLPSKKTRTEEEETRKEKDHTMVHHTTRIVGIDPDQEAESASWMIFNLYAQ